jgi:glutamate racemase
VIGTAGTVASGAYRRALLAIDPGLTITEQACPLLVPMAEEGWLVHPATRLVADEYLAPVRAAHADTLVLGCTHYPLLKPLLSELLGSEVVLIDSALETARDVALALAGQGLESDGRMPANHRWAATDDVARFARVGTLFTGRTLDMVELVELGASPVRR